MVPSAEKTPVPWVFSTSTVPSFNDVRMLKLAREVAMDIQPLDNILQMHDLNPTEWDEISNTPAFQTALKRCVEEWQGATNTQERVKLKSLSFVEEALPEFYARAHDAKETLSSKVELLKTIAKFAGIGGMEYGQNGTGGDKLTVTINLGADHQLKIERDITPQVTIGDNQ